MFIGVHPHYFLCLQTPSPRKEGWPVSVQISEIFCAGSRNTFRNFAWVLFVGGLLMINSWCHKMKQKLKLMDNCWGVFLQFLEGRYQFQIPKLQEENPLMTLKILNDSGKKKSMGFPVRRPWFPSIPPWKNSALKKKMCPWGPTCWKNQDQMAILQWCGVKFIKSYQAQFESFCFKRAHWHCYDIQI